MSVNELLLRWVAVQSLGRKPATQRFYTFVEKNFRLHWPDLQLPAHKITPEIVIVFGQRAEHHSPSMWNSLVCAMRYISPHGKILKRRAIRVRQFVPPSKKDFKKFLAECDAIEDSHAGVFVRFLCMTGVRISEAFAIERTDVLADCLRVRATKNGRERCIPFLPGFRRVLAQLLKLDNGKFLLPHESPRKAIRNACRRAGVPHMSFHCFRHLFTTRCIESGVDIPTVARWLGHSDDGALLSRTYFHLIDEHSRRMAARVRIN